VQVVFSIDLSSNKVKMLTETGEYNFLGETHEEFPSMPQFKGEEKLSLNGDLLRRLLSKTVFAVSNDELRPAMTGVLLQFMGKELRAVATDGHRLVRITYTNSTQTGSKRDVIVPAKALNLVNRSLEESSVEITVDSSHLQFSFGNTTLTSRLIEESYPNYESVIPTDNDRILRVSRDFLLASVRRVALYSSSTTHQVRFSLKNNEMRIAAEDIDFGGEAKERVACEYKGEDLEIGFNSTYVVDILSHLDSDEVEFKFSSPVRATIIGPAKQRENEDLLMLVMPMRLNV
jgi:DNA polymerase-3 subunit beta